jgi:Flp pilus assembly protein TadG
MDEKDQSSGRCRGEHGVAMVELAFVLPILLLIIFGIFQFGRAYNAKVELTGAVREGARAVALGQPAQAAVTAASPGLDPAPSVNVISTCAASPSPGANAVVEATHDIHYTIPFFRTGTWTISARGVMRCGL